MLVQLGNPGDVHGAILAECPVLGDEGEEYGATFVLAQIEGRWCAAEVDFIRSDDGEKQYYRAPNFPEAAGYCTRAVRNPEDFGDVEGLKGEFHVVDVKRR